VLVCSSWDFGSVVRVYNPRASAAESSPLTNLERVSSLGFISDQPYCVIKYVLTGFPVHQETLAAPSFFLA